jgi:hypothetical protein
MALASALTLGSEPIFTLSDSRLLAWELEDQEQGGPVAAPRTGLPSVAFYDSRGYSSGIRTAFTTSIWEVTCIFLSHIFISHQQSYRRHEKIAEASQW